VYYFVVVFFLQLYYGHLVPIQSHFKMCLLPHKFLN